MRVGIFGGTFDPVHQGHIDVAVQVRSRLSLDRVDFVPVYRPPHKQAEPKASVWHRFAMLVLATCEHADLFVSTIEVESFESVYTVDTVRRLKRLRPQAELFFIIGADSFEDITTWKEYERLLESCHFAVMTRPGYSLGAGHLPEAVRRRIVDLRDDLRDGPSAAATEEYRIFLCGAVSNPASSTSIRQALRERRAVDGVSPSVLQHIEKYQLYRDADETKCAKTDVTRTGRTRREPHHRH